ncbi:MAG: glutathione S-transferase family protein [Gemmobacter sp.]
MAYQVIGNIRSRTLRVLWMLEELGQPYELLNAMPRSDSVVAVNPSGKVPVLLVDGEAITDSTAILTYLADRHGGLTHPAGSLDRARQDSLTQFLLDEFDAVLWMAARHSFILPQEHRVPAVKDSLKWEFVRSQAALVARMGSGPFLMGEAITLPDIICAHCLQWAQGAKFPVTEPRLQDYAATMTGRAALTRAMSAGG